MHEINLNLVNPSPNPIRKSWDEQKMQELAQSIKEQGVIVPIKVRPVTHPGWLEPGDSGVTDEMWDDEYLGDTFEIVYGHRRVEAAKRAGLEEIPAIVEGVDYTSALIQAGIENIVREDMTAIETAEFFVALKTQGLSQQEIANRYGLSKSSVSEYVAIAERPKIRQVYQSSVDRTLSKEHHHVSKRAGDDNEVAKVLTKAIDEDLSVRETRKVANAYVTADTPELKQAILETSGKFGDSETITRVARGKIGKKAVTDRYEGEKRQAYQEWDSGVKDMQDFFKMSKKMIGGFKNLVKYEKISPEGAQFTIRRIDAQIEQLQELREVMANVTNS